MRCSSIVPKMPYQSGTRKALMENEQLFWRGYGQRAAFIFHLLMIQKQTGKIVATQQVQIHSDSFFPADFSCRLGLSDNEISFVENGTMANVPHLRELHLDNNALTSVPPGLSDHKYIQVHASLISVVIALIYLDQSLNKQA